MGFLTPPGSSITLSFHDFPGLTARRDDNRHCMMRDHRLDLPPRAARRSRLPASLFLIALAAVSSPRSGDAPVDEALKQSMAVISDGFRGGKPGLLTSIMPEGSKVFVSLENFEGRAGYYGRDQVYFMLGKMFSDLRTLRFELRPQTNSGSPPARGLKPSQIAHCVGNWRYARQDGPEIETQMLFVLSQKNARWSLVQIREAR
jgi:hypothetical protein